MGSSPWKGRLPSPAVSINSAIEIREKAHGNFQACRVDGVGRCRHRAFDCRYRPDDVAVEVAGPWQARGRRGDARQPDRFDSEIKYEGADGPARGSDGQRR